MKRITQIEIENFRAFFGPYKIELPKGENLLVYGENGSGKSSLFKALNNYLSSSRDVAFPFTKNNYRPVADNGLIKITFNDADPLTHLIQAGTEQDLDFGTAASTHRVNFIQDAELIKGFLDYRVLLAVYNHSEPNPNLFELIVTELLKNFIPTGATFSLGKRFTELSLAIKNAYTRVTWDYRIAASNMVTFEAQLRDTLNRIFHQLNLYLTNYFKLNLVVGYNLTPLVASPDNWRNIPAVLKLTIRHDGMEIFDPSEYLNEARLSALSVSLYLAAQKQNPQNLDYKILFLDDVFIGLDSGNRIPITKILNEEFNDYQIFITTYDRSWFELAQRFFQSHTKDSWTAVELYSANHSIGESNFEIPILIPYEENFDKAVYYLHHKSKPDYPAAANFFRKSAEELLKHNLPEHEIRDDNYALIESYKLGALINSGLHFLSKIGADSSLLLELKNALPTLLHPLSHYQLSAQVYKVELENIQELIPKLEIQLKNLKSTYRVFIPQGRMFKLNFTINAADTGHYEIWSKETIYALRDSAGEITVSTGSCHCKTCYTVSGVTETSRHNFSNNDVLAQYISVADGYDKIYNHIHGIAAFSHITRVGNCLTEFAYQNENGNHSLEHHKGLVTW